MEIRTRNIDYFIENYRNENKIDKNTEIPKDKMLFLCDVESYVNKYIVASMLSGFVMNFLCLKKLEKNTVYYTCPYFDEKIDDYLVSISDHIEILVWRLETLPKEIQNTIKSFEDVIQDDVREFMEEMTQPYVNAFEAVSFGSDSRMEEMRRKLNKNTNSGHGYITNDMGFVLFYESSKAILEALGSVSKERQVWNSALEPQMEIHNELCRIWDSKIRAYTDIIGEISKTISQYILEIVCIGLNVSYDKFIKTKELSNVKEYLSEYEKQKENVMIEKFDKDSEVLKEEIRKLDETIQKKVWIPFGTNYEKQQAAKKKKEQLLVELENMEQHKFSEIGTVIDYQVPSDCEFLIERSGFEGWTMRFNHERENYILYSPNNIELCELYKSYPFFRDTYGRFRNAEARVRYTGYTVINGIKFYKFKALLLEKDSQ